MSAISRAQVPTRRRRAGSGIVPSSRPFAVSRASIGLSSISAFTLVELLVGMSLALMVMTAVLTTYVSLARNFTRSLGLSSANQPNLESQARRTLAYFTQDVGMASGISGTPSSTSLTLALPTAASTKNVTYFFNNTAAPVTMTLSGWNTTIPAMSLARVDGSNGATQVLHSSLRAFAFNYYDTSGNPYTSYTNYLSGIKLLAISFTSQAGSSTNGTLSQVYRTDSPRLLIRNKSLLQ